MRGVGAGKAIFPPQRAYFVVAGSVEARFGGDDPHFHFADARRARATLLGRPSRPWGAKVMAEMKGLTPDLQSQWARVRGRLRDEVGDAAYRSWLKSMTLAEFASGRVRIAVPTKFLRDWVAAHYANRIRVLWTGENSAISGVDVVVGASGEMRAEPEPPAAPAPVHKNGRAPGDI